MNDRSACPGSAQAPHRRGPAAGGRAALAWLASLAGLLMAIGGRATAEPVRYALDPEHSFVHFEVLHFGTSTSQGRFAPVSGDVLLDRAARRGEVAVRIATASVDTGLRVFDARLRRDDMLASAAHPEAFFVASDFRFDGDRLTEVRGEFTLRGISQPLSLRARAFNCRVDTERQREVCGGDFEADFNRGDFGITFGLPFIAERVRLVVQVEGVRR